MKTRTMFLTVLLLAVPSLLPTAAAVPGCHLIPLGITVVRGSPGLIEAQWDQTGENCVPAAHCSILLDGIPLNATCRFPNGCRWDPVTGGYCRATATATSTIAPGPHVVVATFTITTLPPTVSYQTATPWA